MMDTDPDTDKASNATTTDTKKKDDENGDGDPCGLEKHYDVVCIGTGLVQSIVAAAVARAGLSVLHTDGQDYYGALDAVWTFPYLKKLGEQGTTEQQFREDDKIELKTVQVETKEIVERWDKQKKGGMDEQDNDNATTTMLPLLDSSAAAGHCCPSFSIRSCSTRTVFPIWEGTKVRTVYGDGEIVGWKQASSSITATSAIVTSRNGYNSLVITLHPSNSKLYIGVPAAYLCSLHKQQPAPENQNDNANLEEKNLELARYLEKHHSIRSQQAVAAQEILEHRSRSLALDVTPGLLFAAGSAVTGMVKSSVSDYCEFKSLLSLLWLTTTNKSDNNNTSSKLEKVPCSKSDVFASGLLSPMDKRRLMKFLQLALDYAVQQQQQEQEQEESANEENPATSSTTAKGKDHEGPTDDGGDNGAGVQSYNERHLNQGRSLARPQNKAVMTNGMAELKQCVADGMSFEEYLTKKHRLSPALVKLVRHALALEFGGGTGGTSLQDSMERLCDHMFALGRFGGTAFLVPLFGSGELPQAFCRSAAVYGATYLLRTACKAIVLTKDGRAVKSVILKDKEQHEEDDNRDHSTRLFMGKEVSFSCSNVVVPEDMICGKEQRDQPRENVRKRKVVRRISVLSGKVASWEQRHVIIIPPDSLGNRCHDTIHCLLLDDSVNVAPRLPLGSGQHCTVLHMTTTIEEKTNAKNSAGNSDGILPLAFQSIVAARDSVADVEEIFHVEFSYSIDNESSYLAESYSTESSGIHLIHRSEPSLAVDPAFDQAAKVFQRICPGQDFLALSKKVDADVKERLGFVANNNEDDDEKRTLESAMDMLDTAPNV